jgi:tetratricopeptide (TPR) repeat protein
MSMTPRRWWWTAWIALAALLGIGTWWITVSRVHRAAPAAAAQLAYSKGDWGVASERARAVLKDAPADSQAIRLMARSSTRLGRDDAALALFDRLKPEALEAEDEFLLARLLTRRGRPDLARARLWAAYGKDPTHGEALHELIQGLVRDDDLVQAVKLSEALRAAPGWRARGAVALGLVRAAQDEPGAAAESIEGALRLDPNLEGFPALVLAARKLLARHRLSLGQPEQARAALVGIDDPEARWLRDRAALQQGRPVEDRSNPAGDPLAQEPAPYVGSAQCAACHGPIARSHRASHHARTFWTGAALDGLPLPGGPLPDPANPAVVHTLQHEGHTTRVETRMEGRSYQAVVAYAFGSGNLGVTPVCHDEAGAWYELRMSRYADGPVWDRTTGQDLVPAVASEWLGKTLNDDELRRCVDCHTTAPRAVRSDAGPLAGDHGIGCERCHGPGGNHLQAVAAGLTDLAIARPKLASGEPIVRLCGRCHSPKGRLVSPSDPTSVRFQATTLTWSRCYTQSRDQLDCVTCHNPHRDAETSPTFYEAKCIECHGPAATSHCPINPTRDCIGCHMPTVRDAIPHSPFTDHHIRVHRRSQ